MANTNASNFAAARPGGLKDDCDLEHDEDYAAEVAAVKARHLEKKRKREEEERRRIEAELRMRQPERAAPQACGELVTKVIEAEATVPEKDREIYQLIVQTIARLEALLGKPKGKGDEIEVGESSRKRPRQEIEIVDCEADNPVALAVDPVYPLAPALAPVAEERESDIP
ncbi:hypothetical protein BJ508DRAFT_364240 [Ascobolus immersus RN42]|uniref:Uncharacterized protein n=1 Tax=Ascobolus immersus RN42 TaxID=1160509 RepID=A0A3N4I7U7_ASCIM|nr:hypothetical protein BJ508DRAFT_364240 [Ascobolus immersus RN42]